MMISCFMNIGYKELYLVKLQGWYPVLWTSGTKSYIWSNYNDDSQFLWPSGAQSYIWSNYNDDILFYDHRVHRVISGQITMMISCFMTIGCTELYLVKLQWWYPVLWTSGTKSYIWSNYNDDILFYEHRVQRVISGQITMMIPSFYDHRVHRVIFGPITMMISCFMNIGYKELYLVQLQWWYPVLWTSGTKSYIWSNYNDDILFYEHRVQRVISGPITMMISCFITIGCTELYLVQLQWWYPVLWTSGTKSYIWSNYKDDILFFFLPSGAQNYIWSNYNDIILCLWPSDEASYIWSNYNDDTLCLWPSDEASYIWSNYNDDTLYLWPSDEASYIWSNYNDDTLCLWPSGEKSYVWSNYNQVIPGFLWHECIKEPYKNYLVRLPSACLSRFWFACANALRRSLVLPLLSL